MRLDHVQFPMPPGREAEADAFYCDLLGLTAVDKPAPLAARGGRWYAAGQLGVHLGIEENYQPSRKAHLCFVVEDYDTLVQRLVDAGCDLQPDTELEGVVRCYVFDPFGNRIELQRAVN